MVWSEKWSGEKVREEARDTGGQDRWFRDIIVESIIRT